jgi:hypothetical protein
MADVQTPSNTNLTYSHRYTIEANNRVYEGQVELDNAYDAADESESQGQTVAMTAAITTFLTAANTLGNTVGQVGNIVIKLQSTGDEGKISI